MGNTERGRSVIFKIELRCVVREVRGNTAHKEIDTMSTIQDFDRLCERIEYADRAAQHWRRERDRIDHEAGQMLEQLEAGGVDVPVGDIVGRWRDAEYVRA
jgi:hypothetical protein